MKLVLISLVVEFDAITLQRVSGLTLDKYYLDISTKKADIVEW